MRLAEKTVELNFCKSFPQAIGHDLLWFGLTQKQEARAGFDACARIGSTLMLFQLKASNVVLKDGTRRFKAEHNQMQTLRNQVKANRSVYYVLPVVGTTVELCGGLCFSHCSRYLDVSRLPSTIPPPLAKGKNPPAMRKNNCHYIDVSPTLTKATIHSDPFDVPLLGIEDIGRANKIAAERPDSGVRHNHHEATMQPLEREADAGAFDEFWSAMRLINRRALVCAYAV